MVKIFVGRLAPSVSSLQLRQLFEKYGAVSDCDILRDYGFVHMSSDYDAQKAINALDKYELCGSRLSVELSTSQSMKSCQLIVKNLPGGILHDDLHKLFKKFGTVTLCKICGKYAIVHMRFPSMATYAVRSLNGETWRGNVLSVEFVNNTNCSEWGEDERNGRNLALLSTDTHSLKPAVVLPPSACSAPVMNNQTPGTASEHDSSLRTLKNEPNPREKRRLRIRQGLFFLKSSMPWNSTAELYKTFLNQLKIMLLEEGLDLVQEGLLNEALAQINEAIHISNCMKIEGIKGHSEIQDRLFLERAIIKMRLGDVTEALQDAENALSVSGRANQTIVRLKARLLALSGQWIEAYCFMVKCQQTISLDPESIHLLSLLKQSVSGRTGLSNNFANSVTVQNEMPGPMQLLNLSHQLIHNFSRVDVPTKTLNTAENLYPCLPTFSYFTQHSGLKVDNFLCAESKRSFDGNSEANAQPSLSSASTTNQDPVTCGASIHQCLSDVNGTGMSHLPNICSLPLFRPTAMPISTPSSHFASNRFWMNHNGLSLSQVQSDSGIDNNLARAFAKLFTTSVQSLSVTPDAIYSNNTANSTTEDLSTPTCTSFPTCPSKSGYTGSVVGPAVLGVGIGVSSTSVQPRYGALQSTAISDVASSASGAL